MRSNEDVLRKNAEYSNRFIQPIGESEISVEIRDILVNRKIKSVIDLGCGDGIFVYPLKKKFPKVDIVGVDISPRRIAGLKERFPNSRFYIRDVCDTKLKEEFDLVYSSQVIEHVSSDKEMVEEMSRLLKSKGVLFCSSVIKKKFAVYKYKCNGKFALDPTHVREYKNQKEFLDLFRKDFKLLKSWKVPVTRGLLGIQVRIPGYSLVYGIWEKRK
ncbi:class I SAM-dependent methyltransferase [Candidatus Pacearchaeota archaeon]|nr:class I SAM-dependent methyltransferase [Candidatus Pacearchaeota archaeon]